MALADIINKIGSDAGAEAAVILDAAKARAAAIVEAAEKSAARATEATLASGKQVADREASRMVVAARLELRDKGLQERRELVARALDAAAAALAELDDEHYTELLASRLADSVSGGETVRFGSQDSARAQTVMKRVEELKPGLPLVLSDEPAPFERGVLVEGDRVRAELSLETIVEGQRDELEFEIASVLFTGEA